MKTRQERIKELRRLLDESILPLIGSDYVLWGLPYYINPGDTLIWEGTLDLLKSCRHKCIGSYGWNESVPSSLSADTTILILGGGFFGDLWRTAWDNAMSVITRHPDNPVIVLPQSIYYENQQTARSDAERLSSCRKLTICTRDRVSFDYGRMMFHAANVILTPDLAFHINVTKLKRWAAKEGNRILYLKRHDKELTQKEFGTTGQTVDVSDWPAMSDQPPSFRMRLACGVYNRICHFDNNVMNKITTKWMYYVQRKVIIHEAVSFISRYKTVYTTRLHAMILSFLLGKEVYFIDNSYGKIGGCYDEWLKGCDGIGEYKK